MSVISDGYPPENAPKTLEEWLQRMATGDLPEGFVDSEANRAAWLIAWLSLGKLSDGESS